MFTADTITDEQIDGLAMAVLQMPDGAEARMIARACVTATRKRLPKRETRHEYLRRRTKARARCAEILNARAEGKS
jgi:hypothetical protein